MIDNSISHITSMCALNRNDIEQIFIRSDAMLNKSMKSTLRLLHGKKLGILFFQPSTRTFLSYQSAMQSLGGSVLGFSDVKTTRAGDFFSESLEDTIQVVGQMVDCIVLRHFESGAAKKSAEVSPVPIINGGDGSNEHPTQALLDLWMMKKYLGGLDNACIGLVGDPSTRVLRSILIGLINFRPKKILFLMPPQCTLPNDIASMLVSANVRWEFCSDIYELLRDADVIEILPIYLPDLNSSKGAEPNKKLLVTPDRYCINKNKILKVGRLIPILHPGPRKDELSPDTDLLPQVLYFKQVKYSVFMRMAILEKLISTSQQEIMHSGKVEKRNSLQDKELIL